RRPGPALKAWAKPVKLFSANDLAGALQSGPVVRPAEDRQCDGRAGLRRAWGILKLPSHSHCVGVTLPRGRAAPAGASAESVPRRGDPREGGFPKVKITPSPIPECRYFFDSGLMGGQSLGDVALFLATSSEQFISWGVVPILTMRNQPLSSRGAR